MESIISTDFSKVTLSSKFLTLKSKKCDVEVDIKKLLQEPVNSDNAYFNATQIAKCYNKDLSKYFRNQDTTDYYNSMERHINFKYPELGGIKLKKTVRGKYHSGTWIHSKVVLHFLRWVDADLSVSMDLFIQDLIVYSNELKIERQNTKIHFKDLTDVIRDIYIPAQDTENAKKFAYNNLATLVNLKVLGCTATKYCKDNGIEIEDDKSIRDYLPKDKVEVLDQTEKKLWALIYGAEIVQYDVLKEKLRIKDV